MVPSANTDVFMFHTSSVSPFVEVIAEKLSVIGCTRASISCRLYALCISMLTGANMAATEKKKDVMIKKMQQETKRV